MADVGESFALMGSGVAIATSIGSLLVSLANYRRDKSHLKLETAYNYVPPDFEHPYVGIRVINDGRYTEIVTGVGFLVAGKQMVLMRPEHFPYENLPWSIPPNESRLAWVLESVLREQMHEENLSVIERTFATTASGRRYENDVPSTVRSSLRRS